MPKVLVGKRHDKVVFMPGKFVFPGGRVDKADNRVPVAAPIPKALEENLLKGSPKITASRARSLAIAAIREACEETGLCLGRKSNGAAPSWKAPWKPFTEAGLLPDPSGLFLIARAITPPGRVRRFDTRFFTADASAIAHRVEGVIHADAELVELVWVEIGSKPLADLHPMTKKCPGRTGKTSRHRPAAATTRRCRFSISTAARCRRMCWGRERSKMRRTRSARERSIERSARNCSSQRMPAAMPALSTASFVANARRDDPILRTTTREP